MEKIIILDGDLCTGCRICELTCSMAKRGEYNPRKSYIRVLANEEQGVYLPALTTEPEKCCPEVGRENRYSPCFHQSKK